MRKTTVSVEIAVEGVYPDGPEAAGKERWVGRERERHWHYMEQKEKRESEPINIHVMNNSLTSLCLFIACLSKTGGNCIQLSMLIRDVKPLQFFSIAKTRFLKAALLFCKLNTKPNFQATFTKPQTPLAKPNFHLKIAQSVLKTELYCQIVPRVNQN